MTPPIHIPLKRFTFACIALAGAAVMPVPVQAQSSSVSPATAAATAPELSPEERRAYNEGLAEAKRLMSEKQWARAGARLDALVQQRPREAQARFLKGVVQTEQGESDAALATFRGLTQDYPEIPEPYNNLAVLYARKGEIDSARIALETAIQTAPNWSVARENLGDIYLRLAVDQYDRAAQIDPANRALAGKLKLARDLLASATPQ